MPSFSEVGGGLKGLEGKMVSLVFVNDELTGYLVKCLHVDNGAILVCDMDPEMPMEFWVPLSSIWRIYPATVTE